MAEHIRPADLVNHAKKFVENAKHGELDNIVEQYRSGKIGKGDLKLKLVDVAGKNVVIRAIYEHTVKEYEKLKDERDQLQSKIDVPKVDIGVQTEIGGDEITASDALVGITDRAVVSKEPSDGSKKRPRPEMSDLDAGIEALIEHMKQDWVKYINRKSWTESERENLERRGFDVEVKHLEKYIKLSSTGFSPMTLLFIVKTEKNAKNFAVGDILKAATNKAPAMNKSRGNVFRGDFDNIVWMGAI